MRNILLSSLLLLGVITFGPANAAVPTPVAGRDYVEIRNGTPLDPVDGKVVVEEFFNYACPYCFSFEPLLRAWTAKLPPYATLVHVPASFRTDFEPYARAYYAAQALGIAEKTHAAVYEAIHSKHTLPGEGDRVDEDKIAAFYAGYGVDRAQFLAAMKGFGVDLKIRRTAEHMARSRVDSTPALLVNGRYLVMGDTPQDVLRIASALIEREHTK